MEQVLQSPDVICEEYDLQHDCITLEEVRWLLRTVKRYSPYWMYFVLRVTQGIRPEEAVQLTLYNLSPDCKTITYRVDKPATRLSKTQEYVQKRKHRRVVLDAWTHRQLKAYLERTCRLVDGVYVSPHPRQKLFPWESMMVVGAYWYKLRLKMHKAGFDSLRIKRTYVRQVQETRRCKSVQTTYVVRPHILRHFAASVMHVKLGNIASVRDWIKHEDVEVTNKYLHSPEAMGTTYEYLQRASWAEILGYHEQESALPTGTVTSQTFLDCF